MEDKLIQLFEKYFGFAWAEYRIGTKLSQDYREDFFEPSCAHLKVACQLQKLIASRLDANEVSITWMNNTSFNVKIDGLSYGVRTMVFKQ